MFGKEIITSSNKKFHFLYIYQSKKKIHRVGDKKGLRNANVEKLAEFQDVNYRKKWE